MVSKNYYKKNKKKVLAQCKEYHSRPEVIERRKWYYVEKTHGLTKDQWYAILRAQGSKCPICNRTHEQIKKSKNKNKAYRTLSVDHNHETGEIRGLLCGYCNSSILPSVNEDPEFVRRLLRYLTKTTHFGIGPYKLNDKTPSNT